MVLLPELPAVVVCVVWCDVSWLSSSWLRRPAWTELWSLPLVAATTTMPAVIRIARTARTARTFFLPLSSDRVGMPEAGGGVVGGAGRVLPAMRVDE